MVTESLGRSLNTKPGGAERGRQTEETSYVNHSRVIYSDVSVCVCVCFQVQVCS